MTTDNSSANNTNQNNNQPNPWEIADSQPKYQPPSSYSGGTTPPATPASNDFDLPASTYRPVYPIPPAPQGNPNGGYTPPGSYGVPPVNNPYQPYTAYAPAQPYNPQADEYRRAVARVNAKLGFYNNLRSYITVNAILWTIWLVTLITAHTIAGFWPIWVTAFWGIGVALHYFNVFGWPNRLEFLNERDRQRLIEEELRRNQR